MNSLHSDLTEQIDRVYEYIADFLSGKQSTNHNARNYLSKLKSQIKEYKQRTNCKSSYAMYKCICLQFLLRHFYHELYCYTDRDNSIIPVVEVIFNEEFSHVMKGIFKGEKVMVKVYFRTDKSDDLTKNTSYEINMYKQLKKIRCPIPHFDTRYLFWGLPCLVMEKLEPLNQTDKPYKIAIDVLKQLKYFHQIGVHSGIKPDNIMRKKNGTYLLIDYGGSTIEPLRHGYKRISWSPRWTCQNREYNQVTTYKHDLIELGYTIKALLIQRMDEFCKYEPAYDKTQQNIKSGYTGRLDKYMKYVMSLKPLSNPTPPNNMYNKLISLFQS